MKHLTLMGMLCLCFTLSGYGRNVTQITYSNLNDVTPVIQAFLEEDMQMTAVDGPIITKSANGETFTLKFAKHANIGKVNYMYIKFNLYSGDTPLIKSCEIYGYYRYVVDFYVRYWPTNINFDDKKNAIAHSYYGQDKATISLKLASRSGNIIIENTTIKSKSQYSKDQNERVAYYHMIRLKDEMMHKKMADSVRRIHVLDSVYRDSLLSIVDKRGIPYGHKTALSPSIEWLEYVLHIIPTGAHSPENNRP